MTTIDAVTGVPEADKVAPPPHHVAAVVIGNALEFFDFLTFNFFAVQIGRAFFPSDNPFASTMGALVTFGVGFIARPIGAIVLGPLADRIGRRPAMVLSFSLMGIGMAGVGLTPGEAQIGVLAPVLVILFRLIQGFALGGEVGSSTAYLIEAAPRRRRGFYVSLQYMGQDSAVLAAGATGMALSLNLTGAQLDAWGWRVPFLIGAAIVPFGLMLRRTLAETLVAEEHLRHAPGSHSFGQYRKIAFLGLVLLSSSTIVAYLLNYLNTYSETTLGMAASLAFGATVTNGAVGLVFDPLSGWMSDRFGRKPMMLTFGPLLLVSILPCFWLIAHFRTGWALYLATAIMSVFASLSTGPALVGITESLPARVRAGMLAIIYAVAISLFGGSAQPVMAWLTELSGNPLTPAFYASATGVLGLVAMLMFPESAPVKVDRKAP